MSCWCCSSNSAPSKAKALEKAERYRKELVDGAGDKVRKRKADVIAAVELGIGNGRVEAINNKIKVTVKMGYGFRNTDNLVGLLMLRCSDCKPQLPGRPETLARKKAA